MSMIKLFQFIFLGFVQGVMEALPISSSGHLLIFSKIINSGIDFDKLAIITNTGSLVAILVIFRKDISKLFKGFFNYIKTKENKEDFNYVVLLILACIPAGLMGLVIKGFNVFSFIEDNAKIVGVSLLITALLLFSIRNKNGNKESKDITKKDALKIGFFQILGLFPGVSRSGSTIVGALGTNIKRDDAFKFSFLLYIPMSLAAMAIELKDFSLSTSSIETIYFIISAFVAFAMTLLFTKVFRKLLNDGKLIYFVYYCLIVGTLTIIFI